MRAAPRIAPLGERFDPFTVTVKRAPSHPVSGAGRYRVTFTHPATHARTVRHIELDYRLSAGSALATLTYAARALCLSPLPTSSHTSYMGTHEGVQLVNVGEALVRVTPPTPKRQPTSKRQRQLPLTGSCRIRVSGAGRTLSWSMTATPRGTRESDMYELKIWDSVNTKPTVYVGPLSEMRRIASTQGAR